MHYAYACVSIANNTMNKDAVVIAVGNLPEKY